MLPGSSVGERAEKRIHCSLDVNQSDFTSIEKLKVEERTEQVGPDDFLRQAGVQFIPLGRDTHNVPDRASANPGHRFVHRLNT